MDVDAYTPWRDATHSATGSEPVDSSTTSPTAVEAATAVASTAAPSSAPASPPPPLSPNEMRAATAFASARAASVDAGSPAPHRTSLRSSARPNGSIPSHPGTPVASPPQSPRQRSGGTPRACSQAAGGTASHAASPGTPANARGGEHTQPSAAAALPDSAQRDASTGRCSSAGSASQQHDEELSTELVMHCTRQRTRRRRDHVDADAHAVAAHSAAAFGSVQGAAPDAARSHEQRSGSGACASPTMRETADSAAGAACQAAESPRLSLGRQQSALDSPTAGGRLFMQAFHVRNLVTNVITSHITLPSLPKR